jgi:hypothetical protein
VVTVLIDTARVEVDGRAEADALWVDRDGFASLTSYELKPEGACRDEVCVPLPESLRARGTVDAAGFWRRTGGLVLHDASRSVWLLAPSSTGRRAALETLRAPDFTLPDLGGVEHSLSDLHGKKVFLATWASW